MAAMNKDFEQAKKQLAPIFESSEQAMYLYFDDEHRVCNQKFAALLGYKDPAQWAAVKESFPMAFVAPASRHTLIGTYQHAMHAAAGAHVEITWQKKGGGSVKTNVLLVPFAINGVLGALHFIWK